MSEESILPTPEPEADAQAEAETNAGRVAETVAGQAERLDIFSRLQHRPFPGGPWLRTPSLVLGMAYHRLKDAL